MYRNNKLGMEIKRPFWNTAFDLNELKKWKNVNINRILLLIGRGVFNY